MVKKNEQPAAATPATEKKKAPSLTARAWARGLGYEKEYAVLTREERWALAANLRTAKTAAQYQGIRDRATARLAELTAAYEKAKTYAEAQIARGAAADAALAGLEDAKRNLEGIRTAISGAPRVAAPPVVPTAAK